MISAIHFLSLFFLQNICSELNWSCNLKYFVAEESCKTAAQTAAVTDESTDVDSDSSHKELEDTLKEYIIIMEV